MNSSIFTTKTTKSRRPTFFIGLMNFKKKQVGKYRHVENSKLLKPCYAYSGLICVFSKKNKIVEKIGSVSSSANNVTLIYLNFSVLFRYLANGANFKICNKNSSVLLFTLSRAIFFFLNNQRAKKIKAKRITTVNGVFYHPCYSFFNESNAFDISNFFNQKRIYNVNSLLPHLGSIVCVFYLDMHFTSRFVVGFCTAIKKKGVYTTFSIYSRVYGIYFTFFLYSACFLGFSVVSTDLVKRIHRKSYYY